MSGHQWLTNPPTLEKVRKAKVKESGRVDSKVKVKDPLLSQVKVLHQIKVHQKETRGSETRKVKRMKHRYMTVFRTTILTLLVMERAST